MKNLIIICGLFLVTSLGFSQEVQPVGEQISENTLKVTYFHSNGQPMHQGNYVDGKNHGLWKSFDEKGNLIAEGSFENGKKVGLWNFYTEKSLNAVIYSDNSIADVKKFYKSALAEK